MAGKPHAWRQHDLEKVFRAARAEGVSLARVEIDPVTGKIIAVPGTPAELRSGQDGDTGNPWDRVLS